MKRLITFLLIAALLQTATAQRYLGGDISLLPSYEKAGAVYRDYKGKQISPLRFFKTQKWNAARVRLFVNPEYAPKNHVEEGVCQDLGYVTALCKLLKEEGYAIMLDFHYSDYWADPGKQEIPHLWKNAAAADLPDTVYRYTRHALERLADAGIEPEMIQVGNEITNGMLWPAAKVVPTKDGNWETLAALLSSGSKACREVCPKAKLIIHTEKPGSWNITQSFYNQLRRRNIDYDIIGLSYYPDYHGTLSTLNSVLTTLESQHADKDIMIVETGYGAKWSLNGTYSSTVQQTWPLSEEGQRKFTTDLIAMLSSHSKVTGLFWWMPEDNEYWADSNPARSHWWNASLYAQDTGKPLAAMFELQRFIGKDPTGIAQKPLATTPDDTNNAIFNLQGQRMTSKAALPTGIYISNGKKFVVGK